MSQKFHPRPQSKRGRKVARRRADKRVRIIKGLLAGWHRRN